MALVLGILLGATAPADTALAGLILGTILVVLGVASVFVAYGLRGGKRWTWRLSASTGIGYVIMGLLFLPGLPLFGVLSVAFGAASIYFVNRKDVKEYLGRSR